MRKTIFAPSIPQQAIGVATLAAMSVIIAGCSASGQPVRAFSDPPGASISQINTKNYELGIRRSATPGEAVIIVKNYTLAQNKSSTLIPEDGWKCNVPEGTFAYNWAKLMSQGAFGRNFFLPTDEVISLEVKNEFEQDGKTWLTGDVSTASGKANLPYAWLFPVEKQSLTSTCLMAGSQQGSALALTRAGTNMFDCGALPRCKFKWRETASVVPSPDEKNFELVFAGEESKNELSFVYRQYVHGNRVPVFEHKFDQSISDPVIKYKNVVIEVKGWNGQVLDYVVTSD